MWMSKLSMRIMATEEGEVSSDSPVSRVLAELRNRPCDTRVQIWQVTSYRRVDPFALAFRATMRFCSYTKVRGYSLPNPSHLSFIDCGVKRALQSTTRDDIVN